MKYDLGDVFCSNFCCLFTLGDAFQARANRARLRSVAFGEKTLRIPIAGFTKLLRLEIGIDGFGVKK
ncbi:MAG: hypothetical protein ACO27Q_10150, partial [Bacteroidia bacterium]